MRSRLMLRSYVPVGIFPRVTFLLIALSLSLLTGCPQQATTTTADTRSADEAALKNLDAEWSKAAGAKDVDKTASYYSDDAIVLPPNMAAINGKQGARA